MPLSPGDKLGPYEILSPLGAGGMGEVYRARDTRLGRDVAIKISKDEFSDRFAREARSIAALNHPNTCHLYDVGPNHLVMEYVEGRELHGPMDFEQALPVIGQLIDGIEAAHEKNIIHRDLKPANIKITADGIVKILDFGLARPTEPLRDAAVATEDSPTFTTGLTERGTILGTAAYMAPEQAKGKTADKRSDIWSFGVILYEMLTGNRPFQGDSVMETLGLVMNQEPDWTNAPGEIQHLLRSCLQKDPKKRLQAIGDARLLLTEPSRYSSEARRTPVGWIPWAAAAIFAVFAVFGWMLAERRATTAPELTLSIVPPAGKSLIPVGSLSTDRISPDGSEVMYRAIDARFHIRKLGSLRDQLMPPFDWAGDAFWAPDSKSVAFPTVSGLMRMQIPNGALQLITTDLNSHVFRGGSWSDKGTILFAGIEEHPGDIGLYDVPAAGGKALSVEVPGLKEGRYYNPEFLPGGEDFIFAFTPFDSTDAQIFLATLRDGKGVDPRLLFRNDTAAAFTSAGGGRVLFVRNDNLYAQKIDRKARHLIGEPELLQEQVASYASPRKAYFSVSNSGTVAWRSGLAVVSQAVIFDRKGNRIGTAGTPVPASIISLSPDEAHLLMASDAGAWVMESSGSGNVSLGSGGQPMAWSPDGSGIIEIKGAEIVQRSVVGAQEARHLAGPFVAGSRLYLNDVSGNGQRILYSYSEPPSLLSFSLGEEHRSQSVVEQGADNAALSPDGTWTVYRPNIESGIYVQPLTSRGLRRQIADRGNNAVWRSDGKEILYFDQNQIWSVTVDGVGTKLRFAPPEPLFSISRPLGTDSGTRPLAVSHDGSRIFFLQSTEELDSGVIQVRTGAVR